MNNTNICRSAGIVLLVIFLGITGNPVIAGEGRNRNDKYYPMADLTSLTIKGQISEINYNDMYMMVDMTPIHVVSNMVLKDGTTFTTDFIGERGNSIPFSSLTHFQRVKVTGYRASDRYIFAVKIERQSPLPNDKKPGVLSD